MSKEKQIEEMAKFICNACEMGGGFEGKCCLDNDYKTCYSSKTTACAIYNAGYRKQSEGEWETIPDHSRSLIAYRHICSECKTFYKDIRPNGHKFCHECGAKMKG